MVEMNHPGSIVYQNQLVIVVGLSIYLSLGALCYMNKVPTQISDLVAKLPDQKYLLGIILLDFTIFIIVHRFQYGCFPPFTMSSLPPPPPNFRPPHQLKDPREPEEEEETPQPLLRGQPPQFNKDVSYQNNQPNDDTSELMDDLESSMKRPSSIRSVIPELPPPPPLPLPLPANDGPEEASLAGDYFNDEASRTIVENWDTDDFTQNEFIPDDLSDLDDQREEDETRMLLGAES